MSKLWELAAAEVLEQLAQMPAVAAEPGHIGLDGYLYKAQQWHVLSAQLDQPEQSILAALAAQQQ